MKKILLWFGIVLGSLLALIVVVVSVLVIKANSKLNHVYDVTVENIAIPNDADAVARGEHWVKAECIGCHGDNLSGGPFFEAPFGYIDAVNLTSGKGGIGSKFTDTDWVRALRHGVGPNGHSLLIMPANDFWYFNDSDLGDIIAYIKSLPPVDKDTRKPNFQLLGKVLLGAGVFGKGVLVAGDIQQDARPATFPAADVTSEYGEYIVNASGCRSCHGVDLSGGKNSDPSAMIAPNLTAGGELIGWGEADFFKAIREGVNQSGRKLKPEQMPWMHYRNFSDNELKAIWRYLQSLPKLATTIP